jgi:hypothetical protein
VTGRARPMVRIDRTFVRVRRRSSLRLSHDENRRGQSRRPSAARA